jgi:hypothetical protein
MRALKPDDLPALNLVLSVDPTLAALVEARLTAAQALLGMAPAPPAEPPAPPLTHADAAQLDDRIAAWFKANPGKHPPSKVAEVFGGSKSTKRSMARLVEAKRITWNGKRGPGSEYGAGK